MRLSWFVARRYLLAKKSHNAINIISAVAVFGVAVAAAAMVCILSVFNGFEETVASLFTAIDPPLKVLPANGKYMAADEPALTALAEDPDIAVCVQTVEENALLSVNNRQILCTIKGVDTNYERLINVPDILVGDGEYDLKVDVIDYGVVGVNLLRALGVDIDFPTLQVYAPRGGERVDLNDPSDSFTQEELYSPGVALCVSQAKYDSHYVLADISFARRLFERQGYVTAIELRPADGVDVNRLQRRLRAQLGDDYRVLNRYEQQEDTFRIMKVEKLISYIFLTFVLLIATFNIVSSLSMLIIEKRPDAQVMRHLGADHRQVAGVFATEGQLIALSGAVIGILVGVALCLAQQWFGLIKFGSSKGVYIIDTYPVSVHAADILVTLLTVAAVGFLAVWYTVRKMTRLRL